MKKIYILFPLILFVTIIYGAESWELCWTDEACEEKDEWCCEAL